MAGPKPVDKATKGLNALVDECTSAVKELVNAGEETAVHLAVGGVARLARLSTPPERSQRSLLRPLAMLLDPLVQAYPR